MSYTVVAILWFLAGLFTCWIITGFKQRFVGTIIVTPQNDPVCEQCRLQIEFYPDGRSLMSYVKKGDGKGVVTVRVEEDIEDI